MVFASICEQVSSSFIFASTSSDQICLASSEHFVNVPLSETSLLLKERCIAPSCQNLFSLEFRGFSVALKSFSFSISKLN